MDYLKILENNFIEENEYASTKYSRLEYLSMNFFDFTTYDNEMDTLFAQKALEVCAAINNGKTFEYIKDKDNYVWYLMLCNSQFFASKLDWGTSIRGAWWDSGIKLNSSGLWEEDRQLELTFTQDEWKELIKAVIEFAAIED